MIDVWLLLTLVAFFMITVGFVSLCAALRDQEQ
jgi:hypothetical protein